MGIGSRIRGKQHVESVVTLEVEPPEPDALERIALLNGAFMRVLSGGAQLVEVCEADYQRGYLRCVVRNPPTLPQLSGDVLVRYEPIAA